MVMYLLYLQRIIKKYISDEMTVYAAQASFFIIMAAFPCIKAVDNTVKDLAKLAGDHWPQQLQQVPLAYVWNHLNNGQHEDYTRKCGHNNKK